MTLPNNFMLNNLHNSFFLVYLSHNVVFFISLKPKITMKTKYFYYLIALTVLFTACEKSDNNLKVKKEVFSGYAQKGPFVIGSSVTISELNANLDQTGRNYFTIISDNSGSFEKKNIELISKYVALKADGYYFNEISGQTSAGQLTLNALVDIQSVNSANINVLTHLEKPRVEYLITQEGMSFTAAKKQAQSEVLAIFGFEAASETSSETLNLTDNAVLLAISCILQGYLSTGDMMELMANIAADIKTDGKLDNPVLCSQLINNVAYIDLEQVISNMEKKYSELGIMVNINSDEFKSYVEQFTQNCECEQTLGITYPETGKYGQNILADEVVEVQKTEFGRFEYSVKAVLPAGNSSLKIVIKSKTLYSCNQHSCRSNFTEWYEICPKCGGLNTLYYTGDDAWGGYNSGYEENWLATNKNGSTTFTVVESGKSADASVIFSYDCIIEYYENGSTTPTKVKELYVKGGKIE